MITAATDLKLSCTCGWEQHYKEGEVIGKHLKCGNGCEGHLLAMPLDPPNYYQSCGIKIPSQG